MILDITLEKLILSYAPSFVRAQWISVQKSKFAERFARGAWWSLIAGVVSSAMTLLSAIIAVRILHRDGFGEFGIIQNTVGLFSVMSGLGLGLTATKYVAEFRVINPLKAGRIIALVNIVAWISGIIAAAVILASAPYISRTALAAPKLINGLRISAIIVLFSGISAVQVGTLSGMESFKTSAWVNLFAGLGSFPMLILGAWTWGLSGAVLGTALGSVFNVALGYVYLYKLLKDEKISVQIKNCFSESKLLWQFSAPSVLANLIVSLIGWICSAILVNQSNGYAEMGLYNAASQWRMVILFIPQQLVTASLPLIAESWGSQDFNRVSKIVRITLFTSLGISAAIAGVIYLASSNSNIMLVYGSEFDGGQTTFVLMLVFAIAGAASLVVQGTLYMMSKPWAVFTALILYGVVVMILSWNQRALGAKGLTLSQIEASVVFLLFTFMIYRKMKSNTCSPGLLNVKSAQNEGLTR